MASPTSVGYLVAGEGTPHQTKLLNKEQLVEWILRRLGAPLLNVQLTCEHVKEAIESACVWFAARKGAWRMGYIQVVPNLNEYVLPAVVDTVIDVVFTTYMADITQVMSPTLLLEEKVPYDVFAAPSSVGLYSSYVQVLQYVEQAKRILSAEHDWEQRGRSLFIAPRPRQAMKLIIEFRSSVFNVEELPPYDYLMLRDYALALTKRDLGNIRSTYASWPGAQGDVQFNGEALLAQASEELEKLEEKIIASGGPMGFITG